MPASALNPDPVSACKICTIRLEELCYKRAWWFRAFREVLATGIRLFAIALWIKTDEDKPRSKACQRCLRFRKNALKRRSPLFNWLDGYLNPLFNRVRDSLLTPKSWSEPARWRVRVPIQASWNWRLARLLLYHSPIQENSQ